MYVLLSAHSLSFTYQLDEIFMYNNQKFNHSWHIAYQFPNNLPCFLAFFVSITCVWTILYACSFHILQDFCLQRFQCSQAVSLSFGMVIVCPGVNAIWQVSVTAMLTFYNFYICSKSCIISKFQHVFENPIVQSLTKVSLLQVMLCF